jgi:hypothetical protein
LRDQLGSFGFMPVIGDHDGCTLGSEDLRNRATDPGSGADDECGFAGKR